ncbi:MAG: tetratricopeptide repeat protein, partial [Pseudomonadota bacterium]
AAWSVVLPPVLLVLEWYFLGSRGSRGSPSPSRQLAPWLGVAIKRSIPFVAIAVATVAVDVAASHTAGAVRALAEHTVLERTMQAFFGLGFYLRKMLVPVGLSPLHELEQDFNAWALPNLMSLAGVVLATIALCATRKRWPGLWTAWLVYFLVLAPTLGFFQIGPHKVADRYSYLASMPLCAVAASALVLGGRWRRRPGRVSAAAAVPTAGSEAMPKSTPAAGSTASARKSVAIGVTATVLIALVLGPQAARYSLAWRDSVSLWRRAVAVDGNSYIALTNLGHSLELAGRVEDAIVHYRRSLEIRPADSKTRYKLGLAYARLHSYEAAIREWQDLVRLAPSMAELHFCIGLASYRLGRVAEAVSCYQRAIAIQPRYVEAHLALGEALASLGRTGEAARSLQTARAVVDPYRSPY